MQVADLSLYKIECVLYDETLANRRSECINQLARIAIGGNGESGRAQEVLVDLLESPRDDDRLTALRCLLEVQTARADTPVTRSAIRLFATQPKNAEIIRLGF